MRRGGKEVRREWRGGEECEGFSKLEWKHIAMYRNRHKAGP